MNGLGTTACKQSLQVPAGAPMQSVAGSAGSPVPCAAWRWPAPSACNTGQHAPVAYLSEPIAGRPWSAPGPPCRCPLPSFVPRTRSEAPLPCPVTVTAPGAPTPSAPRNTKNPEGVATEAAILELKQQIGGLRKELQSVRSNLDAELRKPDDQPQLANMLRQRLNSLCSELADCGTEALQMCSDLGHRPAGDGDSVHRSRSAPGGVWRRASACPPGRNAATRLSTGPPAYPCLPVQLSPRMMRKTSPAEPVAVARRSSSGANEASKQSRGQGFGVNVMTANSSAQSLMHNESTGSFILTARPQAKAQPAPAAPLSPKETLPAPRALSPSPTLPAYLNPEVLRQASAKSTGSDYLVCQNCSNRIAPDAPYCRFCGLERSRASPPRGAVRQTSVPEDSTAAVNDQALREEVLKQLHEMASLRAENARMSDRLISAGFGPDTPRAQPSSPSSTTGSPRSRKRAMEPVREGSPLGHSTLWHKPGRIHPAMKDASLLWSPRRATQHWTSRRRPKPR